MRDITRNRDLHLNVLRSTCKNFNGGCTLPSGCECSVVAEYRGYINTLIPRECQGKTLDQFTGMLPGSDEVVLNPSVVDKARKAIIRYCWGKLPPDVSPTSIQAMKLSVLPKRRENGNSLVIHGNPFSSTRSTDQKIKVTVRKLGRSLLASLVMQEVLKRRLFDGHAADTYEWVQFKTLTSRLMVKDRDAMADYQNCDWLVIDNIFNDTKMSPAQRSFSLNMLDTVLLERIDQRLPTILVFHMDIDNPPEELQDMFGVAIAQIATDAETCRISLTNTQ